MLRSTLLVFSLFCLMPDRTRAEEPRAISPAGLLMKVIDAVVENHIEAPARQQMVLDALRFAAEEQGKPPVPGLSERVSSADRATLERLLAAAFPASPLNSESKAGDFDRLRRIVQAIVPGVSIQPASEHRIQKQFAGNRYVGIGVTAGMYPPTKQLIFISVVPGGAASEAGLRKDDIVETVDGKPTEGKPIAEVIQWLRGEEGTDVTITVRQPDEKEPREYTMTRAIVPFDTVKEPGYSHNGRVAVIGFQRGITASTVNELRNIEAEFPETVEIVTLDFRSLTGRNLHHGILLGNALLDEKPIGQVETNDGIRKVTAEPGALFGDRKLVLLVNGTTQGTALWIAAALHDSGPRDVVLGQSNSDGLVYEGVPLKGDDLVIEMPTARLRRADGSRLASRKPGVGVSLRGMTVVRAPGVLGKLFRQEKLGDIEIEPILQQGSLKVIAEVIASWHERRNPILEKSKE